MIRHVFYLYRTECAQSHMQGDVGKPYPFFFDLFQKFFSKMQAGCRCCRGSLVLGVDRLVPVFILKLMCDVWRERHLSELVQHLFKDSLKLKTNQPVSFIYNVSDFAYKPSAAERDPGSGFRFSPRLYKSFPDIVLSSF